MTKFFFAVFVIFSTVSVANADCPADVQAQVKAEFATMLTVLKDKNKAAAISERIVGIMENNQQACGLTDVQLDEFKKQQNAFIAKLK